MSGADVETRMEAIATRIEGSQAALEAAILDQSTLLRLFLDRLDKLLETQAPKDDSGPTMQEFLAEIVLRLGENTAILRKLDRHLTGGDGGQTATAYRAIGVARDPHDSTVEDVPS
jgi:hypothetical protein